MDSFDALGAYFPQKRRIELYPERIVNTAQRLIVDPCTLMQVILIHEYQHAILHIGATECEYRVLIENRDDISARQNSWSTTYYSAWLKERNVIIKSIGEGYYPSPELEYLAQLGTWHSIKSEELSNYVDPDIEEVFKRLLAKQPDEYQIDQKDMDSNPHHLWFLLAMLRASYVDGNTPLCNNRDYFRDCLRSGDIRKFLVPQTSINKLVGGL